MTTPPSPGPFIRTVACSVCGQPATTFSLAPTDHADSGWLLVYSGIEAGTGLSGSPISDSEASALVEAFTGTLTYAKVRNLGFYDNFGFCSTCETPYCFKHWNVTASGYGRCPQGHGKSLDPHWHPDPDDYPTTTTSREGSDGPTPDPRHSDARSPQQQENTAGTHPGEVGSEVEQEIGRNRMNEEPKPKQLSPQEQEARRKRFMWEEGDVQITRPKRSLPESTAEPSESPVDDEPEQSQPLPRRVAEVLSWGLLVQLIRRHPTRFWLRTTYPIEGIPYDCLALCSRKDPTQHTYLEVNRTGVNARVWLPDGETRIVSWVGGWANRHEAESIAFLRPKDFWYAPQDIQAPNKVWILERERELGLKPPVGALPPSSPASLALRWIAQFLAMQVTAEQPWYAYSADVAGLSEWGGRLHLHHREWQEQHPERDQACLAWLLIRGGDTQASFGLSAEGDLWTPEQHVRLPRVHRSGQPVTRLVLETAGGFLP